MQNLLTCLLCCPDCPNSIAILRKQEVFFAKKTELAGTRHASPYSREARWCEHQGAAVNYSDELPLFAEREALLLESVSESSLESIITRELDFFFLCFFFFFLHAFHFS